MITPEQLLIAGDILLESYRMIAPESLVNGTEKGEQRALFAWAALSGIPELKWLFHIPNENQHRLVADGVRSGVPDVCLPIPTYYNSEVFKASMVKFCGCYIEMKRPDLKTKKDGGVGDDQLKWHIQLRSVGYRVEVCYSWLEAKAVLLDYLGRNPGN